MEQTKIKKYIIWSRILIIAGIVTSSYVLMMDLLISPDFINRGQKNIAQVISFALVSLGMVFVFVSQEKFSLKKFLIGAFIVLVGLLAITVLLPYSLGN